MHVPDDRYSQDEAGQWWFSPANHNRTRAFVQKCGHCGQDFVSRRRHPLCSAACRVASITGKPKRKRTARPCEWCGLPFTPHRSQKKCCSLRCAYDLGNSKRGSPGPRNGNWKGGVKSHSHGYVLQWVPDRGHLLQHRLVMEQMLGRPLAKGENVHHKNGVRDDNRPENLELWKKHQPPGQRTTEQRHCPTCTCGVPA